MLLFRFDSLTAKVSMSVLWTVMPGQGDWPEPRNEKMIKRWCEEGWVCRQKFIQNFGWKT